MIYRDREEFQKAIKMYSNALERYGPDHKFADYCRKQIANCKRRLSKEDGDD